LDPFQEGHDPVDVGGVEVDRADLPQGLGFDVPALPV